MLAYLFYLFYHVLIYLFFLLHTYPPHSLLIPQHQVGEREGQRERECRPPQTTSCRLGTSCFLGLAQSSSLGYLQLLIRFSSNNSTQEEAAAVFFGLPPTLLRALALDCLQSPQSAAGKDHAPQSTGQSQLTVVDNLKQPHIPDLRLNKQTKKNVQITTGLLKKPSSPGHWTDRW